MYNNDQAGRTQNYQSRNGTLHAPRTHALSHRGELLMVVYNQARNSGVARRARQFVTHDEKKTEKRHGKDI